MATPVDQEVYYNTWHDECPEPCEEKDDDAADCVECDEAGFPITSATGRKLLFGTTESWVCC